MLLKSKLLTLFSFFVLLFFSCNQTKDKSEKDIKIEQTDVKKNKDNNSENFNNDSLQIPSRKAGLSNQCDCTCSCGEKIFTITVYPCKNKEITCERECKKKCP